MHTPKNKKKSLRKTHASHHGGPVTNTPSSPAAINVLPNDLEIALRYHQAGQIEQAEKIYRTILTMTPDHADALHLLGEIALRRGLHDTAADLISRAIQVNPNNASYYHNLGLVYRGQERLTEAAVCYEHAIRLNPAMTMSLNNLGLVMQAQGRYDEAVANFQKALAQDPSDLAALNNLGLLCDRANQLDDALACFQKMLRINPQVAEAYNNLGLTLQKQGKTGEAVIAFEQAIHITPDYASAYNNLGNSLKQLQKFDEAIDSFKQALKIDPNYAEALNNMGEVWREMQNYDEAMSCFRKALEIKPEQAEILNNIGIALHEQGKMAEAIASFQQSLQLNPRHARTYSNLGLSLLVLDRPEEAIPYFEESLRLDPDFVEGYNNQGLALRKLGHLEQAAICFNKTISLDKNLAQAHSNLGNLRQDQGFIDQAIACFRTAIRLAPNNPELHSNLLFCLNYAPDISQEEMMAEAEAWWEHHGHASKRKFSHDRKESSHRRLKIGYVSPDFRQHSVSFFFLPLIKSHDPQHFETFCYGEVLNPDRITAEIIKHTEHYRSTVGLRHETMAELIYQDEIDILVDLAGHTAQNRLPVFALRPAPIQLTWLGYPNTTGLRTIDFRLTDAVADPEGEAEYHSETLVRLTHGFLCYTPPSEVPEIGELPAHLTNRVTFGSFNNLPKINSETIKIWSEIMHRVPDSRLMLKSKQLADAETKKQFLERFAQEGIKAERIIMLERTPLISDHLNIYNQVDIGLDPFPYNGTTTTFEALMMGVPVITLRGDRHAGRVGASILTHMDLKEMIAEGTEDYIAKAIDLAADRERLAFLRKSLRTRLQHSPFCDTKHFTADMEEIYQRLWSERYSSESNETRLTQEPTSEEIGQLVTLFNQGRYIEGEAFARRQTKRFPQHGFGWKALGVMYILQGRSAESLEPMQKAAILLSMDAETHNNLGNTLRDLGRLEEAEASYRQALEIKHDFAEAHNNLGNTLYELGRMQEAEASFCRALAIKPDYAEAHYNLGKILKDLGRLQEAEASFRWALAIKPNFTEVLNNLSNTLQELGRLQEAESCCRRALEIKPDFAKAHNNLGNTLKGMGRLEEAEACYRRALESKPNFAEAHNNLGNTLRDLGLREEAITCFRQALASKPDFAEAHCNLGSVLNDLGRLEEAEASNLRALENKPDFAEAQSNLGNTLSDLGRLEEAITCYRAAIRLAPGKPELHSNLLFALNYAPGMSQEQMMAEAAAWWEQHGQSNKNKFSHDRKMDTHRRLKIGYISPDFRLHSVSFFFLPLIKAHDPEQVETFCYGEVTNPDRITAEIIKHSNHYRPTVGLRHETLAELIYQDEIDILVDLAGHTAHNRLPVFALCPAPIQLTWLGYPNTTGLPTINFRLTDAVADPEGTAGSHSEILIRLPHGFLCYTPPSEVPEVGELPASLTNRITFGSFNNLPKTNRETIKIWSAIMHKVPGSRLTLKNKQLADSRTKKYFLEMFAEEGIEDDRIIMLAHTPSISDHLELYNKVDIGLDPFPYNGTTTTFEALFMGVPVITLRGDRHAGRVGASILTHMDLKEMIAEDTEDYIAKAIDLAADRDRLAFLRKALRTKLQQSPCCDAKRFAADMEETYERLWREKYS